jgi:hypothetical protein
MMPSAQSGCRSGKICKIRCMAQATVLILNFILMTIDCAQALKDLFCMCARCMEQEVLNQRSAARGPATSPWQQSLLIVEALILAESPNCEALPRDSQTSLRAPGLG